MRSAPPYTPPPSSDERNKMGKGTTSRKMLKRKSQNRKKVRTQKKIASAKKSSRGKK